MDDPGDFGYPDTYHHPLVISEDGGAERSDLIVVTHVGGNLGE